MSSNLTILQRNMTSTMSDDAAQLYLRAFHKDEWKACNMAWEWDKICEFADLKTIMIDHLNKFPNEHRVFTSEQTTEDVFLFLRERHYRRYFPAN